MERILENIPVFFLIFVRTYALIRTAPITSSSAIPGIARIALVFFTSFAILPSTAAAYYPVPQSLLGFFLLAVGEALIGIITAFFLVVFFTVFQLAGQFFSIQMGFGASQVFDPQAQIELPLVGQFFNIIAVAIFLVSGSLQRVFLHGILGSFHAIRAADFALSRNGMLPLILASLGELFEYALILAFPILGTLFLLQLTMGLLGKAAPQMNLLLLGFPAAVGLAFVLILATLPFLVEVFDTVIEHTFEKIGAMNLVFSRGGR